MRIFFNEFMQKAARVTGCPTQMGLADLLEVSRSAVTQAKNRDMVPEKWLLVLARKFALPPDWFERDYSFTSRSRGQADEDRRTETDQELIMIPKVSAILCAGGGSLETEAEVVEYIPLPLRQARIFGTPSHLIFMDVAGDSMEPGIRHGDTLLIDQSVREAAPSFIMAVGHEENIYIKRLKKDRDGGLTLVSDNPLYRPVRLAGDELDSFRVIGKAVRLFRDL